jgi:hypothetical protein
MEHYRPDAHAEAKRQMQEGIGTRRSERWSATLRQGYPPAEIIRHAGESTADLLVLGCRRRSEIEAPCWAAWPRICQRVAARSAAVPAEDTDSSHSPPGLLAPPAGEEAWRCSMSRDRSVRRGDCRAANRYGANRLAAPRRRSAWHRLLLQFHNILLYVMMGAALIVALLALAGYRRSAQRGW